MFLGGDLRVKATGLQLGHQAGDSLGHLSRHLGANGQGVVHGRLHGTQLALLLSLQSGRSGGTGVQRLLLLQFHLLEHLLLLLLLQFAKSWTESQEFAFRRGEGGGGGGGGADFGIGSGLLCRWRGFQEGLGDTAVLAVATGDRGGIAPAAAAQLELLQELLLPLEILPLLLLLLALLHRVLDTLHRLRGHSTCHIAFDLLFVVFLHDP